MAVARNQFRRVAERYAQSRIHSDKKFLAKIASLTKPRKGQRLLDVATGPGFVGVEFAKKGLEVVGTDITVEMLNHAKELRGRNGVLAEFVLAEASHQPFRSTTFDIAVSRLAFHHMKDPRKAVESMIQVVKPGGRVVVADLVVSEDDEVANFHNSLERFRDPSHVRSLKLSEWKRILSDFGFRIVRVVLSKVKLEVTEWAERSRFPKEEIPELMGVLEKAPAKARKALNITHRGGHVFFQNTRAILVGAKPQKPSARKASLPIRKLAKKVGIGLFERSFSDYYLTVVFWLVGIVTALLLRHTTTAPANRIRPITSCMM